MEYIKHNGQFFKKIDLKELDKKELIKLITEAIEIEPRVIERRHSYPRWWYNYKINTSDSSISTNAISTSWTLTNVGSIIASLNNLTTDNLITLASTI